MLITTQQKTAKRAESLIGLAEALFRTCHSPAACPRVPRSGAMLKRLQMPVAIEEAVAATLNRTESSVILATGSERAHLPQLVVEAGKEVVRAATKAPPSGRILLLPWARRVLRMGQGHLVGRSSHLAQLNSTRSGERECDLIRRPPKSPALLLHPLLLLQQAQRQRHQHQPLDPN